MGQHYFLPSPCLPSCLPLSPPLIGDNIITWQSQKQKVVTLSSCEAVYIAAMTVACQGVWLACLLAELWGETASDCSEDRLPVRHKHNKNPVFHDRSKHRYKISLHPRMHRGRKGECRVQRHHWALVGHYGKGVRVWTFLRAALQDWPRRCQATMQGLGGDLLVKP